MSIKIVLVGTTHPGNIGAAARAMKTMGLTELVLVSPKILPNQESIAMAAGAKDVLASAKIVDSVEEAINNCQLVLATSARDRAKPWPMLSPREMGEKIAEEAPANKIALLFGREHSGLTNEELQLAHYHVQIPANEDYSSLNLAQAVQILCYEIRVASHNTESKPTQLSNYPTASELESFYQHLEQVLVNIDFIDPQHPKQTMQNMRRLFNRARLEELELKMLRGVLASLE